MRRNSSLFDNSLIEIRKSAFIILWQQESLQKPAMHDPMHFPSYITVSDHFNMKWILASALLVGCARTVPPPTFAPVPPERPAEVTYVPEFARLGPPPSYFVGGEVKTPGRLPYIGPLKLTQAIESAGGFTALANRKRLIIRRVDGKVERYVYDRILKTPTDDPPVWPGDRVDVQQRGFAW